MLDNEFFTSFLEKLNQTYLTAQFWLFSGTGDAVVLPWVLTILIKYF
jgi:hypothetical protein